MKMNARKVIVFVLLFLLKTQTGVSQIDTSFWFAAPWVTPDHTERNDIVVHISTFSAPTTTVRLRQPAAIAPNQYDTTIIIPANTTFDYTFKRDRYVSTTNIGYDSLEVRPANTVVPYGIYISSTSNITVVYDVICSPPGYNNPETFCLMGQNGLGTEFVCPQQTLYRNRTLGDRAGTPPGVMQPKQQIVIVATKPNTVVWITPRANVVGHPANVTYSIMLPSAGSCYNIENVVQTVHLPGNSLSGTVIVSDKPIAVTVADDSINNIHSSPAEPGVSQWGGMGCYDLIGDQIVPVDVVGRDYIINRGLLFRENELGAGNPGMKESAFIVATDNFTQLTIIDGTQTVTTILNKGDTYVDTLASPVTYIHASKNVYVYHVSGMGCELGSAILPPLTCAGSKLVAFSRNTPQRFALNILCKNGSQGTFTLNGSTTLVPASAFTLVPGTATLTGGPFWGAQIDLTSQAILPIGSYTIGNNTDEFALGVFDASLTTGGLFHYMSSFLRTTEVDINPLNPICAGQEGTVAVTGTVSGADITGYWATSYSNGTVTVSGGGTGTFSPVYSSSLNVISTIYSVSINDTTSSAPTKSITLYLISTGSCRSVMDSVVLVINQRPKVFVTPGTVMCKNNILPIALSGTVMNALSGQWGGGNGGQFGVPGLVTTYTPSATDLTANSITLSLTSQQPLFGCPNSVSSITVGFINPPVVSIVPNNFQVCTNSTTVALNGNISGVTTSGIWLGGTGAFTLTNASPTTTYILSPADLTQSSITLTLSSTNNGICTAESNTVLINVIPKPTIEVPENFPPVCLGAGSFVITGTVSGTASQGVWTTSNGSGVITPNSPQNSPINATYFINQSLDTSGTLNFIIETVGGVCPTEKDSFSVVVLKPPVVKVNESFTPVCRNVPVALTGTVTGYTTTGLWSSSSQTSIPGIFNPGPTILNGFYEPSEADYSLGYVVLTLASTNNGFCPPSSSAFTASFVSAPEADFSTSPKRCVNTAVDFFSEATNLNGTSSPKFSWDFGDELNSGSTAADPKYTYANPGQYNVSLTVTAMSELNVECPDVITKTITIKPLPIADFDIAPACQDMPVVLINKSIAPPGSEPITLWDWEFNCEQDKPDRQRTGVPTTTISFPCDKPGDKTAALTVTAGLNPNIGCVSDIKIKGIFVFPKPKAEFGLTNNPTVVQEPVYFSDFSTPVGNILSWFWEFGDEGSSEDQAPIHTYQQAGIYSVKLTIMDSAGCVDTLRKDIDVTLLPQVPLAFSPNGDGHNDLLFVKGGPFQKMVFRVYNSWGQLLFETQDQSIGWDGRKNGVDQPIGVYVWTLTADMYNNRQVKKNGDVQIIR